MTTPPEFGHSMRDYWMLDPEITYLNHGTVGAPPKRVLEVQQRLRDEIERQPSRFLLREISPTGVRLRKLKPTRLRDAGKGAADDLDGRGEDLQFVAKPTLAINDILPSV